jgi:dTDP-L-rhamnose 4-epimerase
MRTVRTLVTGGAGFVGSHVVDALLARGDEVVVLDCLEPQVHLDGTPAIPGDVEFIHGNVGDTDAADRALRGVERIVHLAAVVGVGQSMYEMARYVRQNSLATAAFLERVVARGDLPQRLVVASSMSIYGEGEYECPSHGLVAPTPRPEEQLLARQWECRCALCGEEVRARPTRETKPLIPTSVYAVTKRDHEELCLVAGSAYAVPTVALRFFNVYGPRQALSNPYTGVAAIFASRLLNDREPIVFEDGLQCRDFIHVSDIVAGVLLALEADEAAGRALNLGTGKPSTVLDVAHALAAGLDLDLQPRVVGQYRAGDIRHCFADTALAKKILGFQASVSLSDGMRELVEWLAGQSAVDGVDLATSELSARGLTR